MSLLSLDTSYIQPQTAVPIIEKIDPFTLYVSYKLFRESTRSADGRLVKVMCHWILLSIKPATDPINPL